MKALKLIAAGVLFILSNLTYSQVSVNVNIGTPPMWGPVGYPNVEFYYLPDVEAYYDIRTTEFIYFHGGVWVRSVHLPNPYRHYDLYHGYKVVLSDYHGHEPYVYFKEHKVKYHKGYKGSPQQTIGKNPHSHHDNGNHGEGNQGNGDNGNHGHKEGKGHGKH